MLFSVSLAVASLLIARVVPAVGASPGNACALVTPKDVQGVLGSGYTPREDVPLTGQTATMSNCAYSKSEDNAVVISLSLIAYDSAQYLNMMQTGIKQQGGAVTPVGGLGDGAFYVLDSGQKPPFFQLHFGRGNREVILSILTSGKPNVDAAQKLAKIAYSRLR